MVNPGVIQILAQGVGVVVVPQELLIVLGGGLIVKGHLDAGGIQRQHILGVIPVLTISVGVGHHWRLNTGQGCVGCPARRNTVITENSIIQGKVMRWTVWHIQDGCHASAESRLDAIDFGIFIFSQNTGIGVVGTRLIDQCPALIICPDVKPGAPAFRIAGR